MKQSKKNKCYLCGNDDLVERGYNLRDSKDLRVLECKKCSLVFLSSFEHINQDFYKKGKMHSISFNPQKWLKASKKDDERRFEFLKNRIENKTLLDFGCGAGGFLLLAKEVADVEGVEEQENLKDFFTKNGLRVFSSLEEIGKKYDVITMFHVLEHLKEPKKIVADLLEYLKDDGELIIEVPNENDALLTLYKCRAFGNFTHWSCHLFCFNQKTLKKLFLEMGLEINYITPVQRFGFANHLYWLLMGQKGGQLKWTFLNKFDWIYKKIIIALGKSDTLIISVSKKKEGK